MKILPSLNRHRNRGAVLFVSLIMLLLLTLLGVTAMQVTVLQERMSGNFRAQQQAFERSEGRMAEGRDMAGDPLWAYDNIPDVPVRLVGEDMPWTPWLTTYPPEDHFTQAVRLVPGNTERRGSGTGDDPNKKPRFYVISAQEQDPGSPLETATWATVQTIYVY